ncbi:MAG: lectin like domain-containing protein [Coriobacteriales bacterium]|nr:lectin like domain-containing protein [Coriobacteriales bacterium]
MLLAATLSAGGLAPATALPAPDAAVLTTAPSNAAPTDDAADDATDEGYVSFLIAKNRVIATTDYELYTELPSRFDLRDEDNPKHNYLTPVRNQNPYGVCWSFGVSQALEAAVQRAGLAPSTSYSADNWISTIQLANAVYNPDTFWEPADPDDNPGLALVPMAGAPTEYPIAALSKWFGPTGELVAPWPYGKTTGNDIFYDYLLSEDEVRWVDGFVPEEVIERSLDYDRDSVQLLFQNTLWNYDGSYTSPHYNSDLDLMAEAGGEPYTVAVRDGQPLLPADQDLTEYYDALVVYFDYQQDLNDFASEVSLTADTLIQNEYLPEAEQPQLAGLSDFHLKETTSYPINYLDVDKTVFSPENIQIIKQGIYEQGALEVGYKGAQASDTTYFNSDTSAQYVSDAFATGDHAVALVGWDDDFGAENFSEPLPPGPGAFIVKNSWGEEWGEGGFFYLSYYDRSIDEVIGFTVEDSREFELVSYYDDTGQSGVYMVEGQDSASMANVFAVNSGAPQTIEAVSVLDYLPHRNYEIRIYTGVEPGAAPTEGTLAAEFTANREYAGLATYPLPSDVQVVAEAGSYYSVVVEVQTDGEDEVLLPCEARTDGLPRAAQDGYNFSVERNQSLLSLDGTEWLDVMDLAERVSVIEFEDGEITQNLGNFTVKALGNSLSPQEQEALSPEGDLLPIVVRIVVLLVLIAAALIVVLRRRRNRTS